MCESMNLDCRCFSATESYESTRYTCLLLTGTEEIIYQLNITVVINIRATNFYHFFLFLISTNSSDVSTESRFFIQFFLIAYLVQRKLEQIKSNQNNISTGAISQQAHLHHPDRRSYSSRLKIAISFWFFLSYQELWDHVLSQYNCASHTVGAPYSCGTPIINFQMLHFTHMWIFTNKPKGMQMC